tara:strand:- start:10376 stop:11509 length:1134 start_codon:yes stop_codon:yes gene_type:complete
MAYYSIFPEKDTTIYSHHNRSDLNTGNDEILELVKEKGSTNNLYYPSRILLQFSNSDIQLAIAKSNNFTSSLELFSAEHKNLSAEQSVEVFPLSSSWNEGTGKYSNLPISSNGSSWLYKDNDSSKTKWLTSSFGVGSTGSISTTVSITKGGGEWYTGSLFKGTQTFSNADSLDLNVDVTNIVQKFSASINASQTYPTGIPNYGFILKNSDTIEENVSSSNGTLQYFSVDTHTIYPPKLTFKWDDSIHEKQSSAKLEGDLSVSLYNNKREYNKNDVAKIKLHVRDKYPTRQFTSSSNYLNSGYFTTSSYYSIRDAHTEEVVIPFDNYNTKLSANNDGMYFNLYMNGLQPERYYRILFKHINNDGTQIYDDNYHFKVVR